MTGSTTSAVTIQTSPQSVPSPPQWLGEVTLIVSWLARQGMLATIAEQVRFAPDPRPTSCPAPLASPLCARLPGTQARGDRAHPHHRLASPYAPMARHLRECGQRRVSGRAAPGGDSDRALRAGPPPQSSVRHPPPGWAIWDWSGPLGPGGPRLCDAGPRLSPAGSGWGYGLACTCPQTSASRIQKAGFAAPSTTVRRCPWGRRGRWAGSSSPRIRLLRGKVGWVWNAKVLSTSSS